MPSNNSLLAFVAAAALLACASQKAAQGDGSPTLERVASIELAGPDTAPMGNYLFPSKRADGTLYVADMTGGRVLQFDGRGGLTRIIGRKGQGPGEFSGPGMNRVIEDGRTLAVFDIMGSRMHLFRADSASFIRSFLVPGNSIGFNWNVRHDTLLFALNLSTTIMARWVVGSDSVTTWGETPQRLLDDPFTSLQHGRSEVARTDQRILALLQTEPGLHLLDIAGKKTGFVTLPSRRRRGEPSDLFDRAKTESAKGIERNLAPAGSAVAGLQELSNGSLVTVMLDVDQVARFKPETPGAPIFGNYRLWASLVRKDLSAACVDVPIPVTTDVVPMPFFSGDTLWVLSISSDSTDAVQTKVEGYLLGDEGCEWLPTGGVGAARP